MFHYQQSSFGPFTRHRYEHPDSGTHMVLVPEKGGCMTELTLRRQEIFDGYRTPDELDRNSGAKGMPLFPFPNRLAGGTYTWEGINYAFPINDKARPNALHGFSREQAMKITHQELNDLTAYVICTYHDPGLHKGYPFPFKYEMAIRLDYSGSLEVEMHLTNEGTKPIPAGFGWHPYFRVDDRLHDMVLHLPSCQLVEVDEHLIPTGERTPFRHFSRPQAIGNFELDNCFALTNEGKKATLTLEGSMARLRYWQETGPGKFNFIQLYTPEDRQSIAIEPMTCNIDAFNNGDGLIRLEPDETVSARFGLVLMEDTV